MGRWFGYRPGYEDLPRLWVQRGLAEDYRFLALVEAELRADIADMERQQLSPAELGVRVRQHPGRLAIVARNKMGAAGLVRVSYAGERLQTFILDKNPATASNNIEAAREFLGRCLAVTDAVATPATSPVAVQGRSFLSSAQVDRSVLVPRGPDLDAC